MFKANSIRTACAPAEGHAASPADRRFRVIVSIAAMAACGLFAVPLQADHETLNVVVTLEATPGDGYIGLQASHVGIDNAGGATDAGVSGYEFREKRSNGSWDDSWWSMYSDGSSSKWNVTNGTAYTFQARAYKTTDSDGEFHRAYSDPSAAVTVTPTASAQ